MYKSRLDRISKKRLTREKINPYSGKWGAYNPALSTVDVILIKLLQREQLSLLYLKMS